jgi:hypothetical protein
MTPPPDKIRPWVEMGCRSPECGFRTAAEWAALRHESETGHTMDWPSGPVVIRPVPRDAFPR